MPVSWHGDSIPLTIAKGAFERQLRRLGLARSPAGSVRVYFPEPGVAAEPAVVAAATGDDLLIAIPTAASAAQVDRRVAHVNMFRQDRYPPGAWPAALADEILARLWTPRRTRRVFISYRRVDSAGPATQLFDRFSHLGYQVFLDTASVDVGLNFQEELGWWLVDADLVVLLGSPRFLESTWTRREVEFAKAASLGVLEVRWPDASFPTRSRGRAVRPLSVAGLDPTEQVELDLEDLVLPNGRSPSGRALRDTFRGPQDALHRLSDAAADRVVAQALHSRVVAIHRRREAILDRLRTEAALGGHSVHEGSGPGDLLLNGTELVRALPCRPDPQLVVDAQAATVAASLTTGTLAYLETAPKDPRIAALRLLAERGDARSPLNVFHIRPIGVNHV